MKYERGSGGGGDDSYLDLFNQQIDHEPRKVQSSGGSSSGANTASGALMATGNPYAIAAGVSLQVLSAKSKRKQKEQELKAQMKLDRISRQQKALSGLMNVSQRLTI